GYAGDDQFVLAEGPLMGRGEVVELVEVLVVVGVEPLDERAGGLVGLVEIGIVEVGLVVGFTSAELVYGSDHACDAADPALAVAGAVEHVLQAARAQPVGLVVVAVEHAGPEAESGLGYDEV